MSDGDVPLEVRELLSDLAEADARQAEQLRLLNEDYQELADAAVTRDDLQTVIDVVVEEVLKRIKDPVSDSVEDALQDVVDTPTSSDPDDLRGFQ